VRARRFMVPPWGNCFREAHRGRNEECDRLDRMISPRVRSPRRIGRAWLGVAKCANCTGMNVTRWASILMVTLLAMGSSCSKSEAATEPTRDGKGALAPAAVEHNNDNYKVKLEAVGSFKKDQPGIINVVLETKGEYHINKQYPYKFATQDPPADGVTYPKKVVPRADGTYEERKAVLPIPFVPTKSGQVTVGGLFSLSVCTDANCLMDKQRLEISVKVD